MPQQQKKSCCSWWVVLCFFILLIVAGILIWQFVPFDDIVNEVVPDFGGSDNDNKNDTASSPSTPVPSPPPIDMVPTPSSYKFNQCQNPNDKNCCNGLDTICDFRVNQVMFATAHNAMASREPNTPVGFNHYDPLESALMAGYRGINLDVCMCGAGLQFCHSVCNFGYRDAEEVLQSMVTFLRDHPRDVLIVNFQMTREQHSLLGSFMPGQMEATLDDLKAFMDNRVPDFSNQLYVHPDLTSEWPTLRELIDDHKKRIIAFHHNGAITSCDKATTEDGTSPCPAGLHYYHDFTAETDFSLNNREALLQETSCEITRGQGSTNQFFHMNHFVTPPNPLESEVKQVNKLQVLQDRMTLCSQVNGDRVVSSVYVDFWSVGDLPQATQEYNRAQATRRNRKGLLR